MSGSNSKYYGSMLVATFTWGASWVSAKILVDIAPPLTIGFFRFLIASILFSGLLIRSKVSLRSLFSKANMKWLVLLGLTGIFGYGVLFLVGMTFTTAVEGSIIAGFNPVTISIFAHLIHNERMQPKWKYSGFALSFIGVIFVVGIQALIDFQPEHLLGNLIILGAMCIWGLYSSMAKSAMKTMTPLEATGGSSIIGVFFFGAGALLEQPWTLTAFVDMGFWINVAFLGIFTTVIGFLAFFLSVEKLGATRAGGFINFVPVFGIALSVLILQETIYWTFMLGLLFIITGVSIMNYSRNRTEEQNLEVSDENMQKG